MTACLRSARREGTAVSLAADTTTLRRPRDAGSGIDSGSMATGMSAERRARRGCCGTNPGSPTAATGVLQCDVFAEVVELPMAHLLLLAWLCCDDSAKVVQLPAAHLLLVRLRCNDPAEVVAKLPVACLLLVRLRRVVPDVVVPDRLLVLLQLDNLGGLFRELRLALLQRVYPPARLRSFDDAVVVDELVIFVVAARCPLVEHVLLEDLLVQEAAVFSFVFFFFLTLDIFFFYFRRCTK